MSPNAAVPVFLLVVWMLSPVVHAQNERKSKQTVTISAASGAITGLPIRAGNVLTIRIIDLNPLCFSYRVRGELLQPSFPSTLGVNLIDGSRSPSPTPGDSPLAHSGQVDAVADRSDTQMGMLRATMERQPTLRGVEAVTADSLSIAAILAGLRLRLLTLDSLRSAAEDLFTTVAMAKCAHSAADSSQVEEWKTEAMTLGPPIRKGLMEILDLRSELRTASLQTGSARNPFPLLITGYQVRVDSMHSALTRAERTLATLRARLEVASRSRVLIHEVAAGSAHNVVRVHLEAIPFDSGTTQTSAIDIPLRRQHRVVFSTGVLGSTASSVHYDRVNRLASPSGGTTASDAEHRVISTFARKSGNSLSLLNPALFVSLSLTGNESPIGIYGTAGTILRSLGGESSLEPLLGAGIGALDRLYLQIGVHFGRTEELLLTLPGETATSKSKSEEVPIPINITRSDAVGLRWRPHGYIGFSVRLN